MIQSFVNTLFIGLSLLLLSCKNSKDKPVETKEKTGIVQDDSKIIQAIGETLKPMAKKEIAPWKAYWDFDAFLTNYYSISSSEALSNAKELKSLALKVKDSLKIPLLKKPDVLTRIHILQNECLRLSDMSEITAITPDEVKHEVKSILEAFSALNAKINAVYNLHHMENELELDPDFTKVLQIDSLHSTEKKPFVTPKKPPIPRRKIPKLNRKLIRKRHGLN